MSLFSPAMPQDNTSKPLLTKRAASIVSYKSTTGSSRDSKAPTETEAELEESHPEGGVKAWSSVFASFCGMTCSAGTMNSIGTFQSYISRNQLFGYSDADIGWIFGLYLFVTYFGGIVTGPVFDDQGPRILMAIGTLFLLASVFLLGTCTRQ